MKKISLLGSTGSIGTQSLDVCEMHGYDVKCLTANSKVDIMEEQIRKFKPDMVCMMSETAAKELKAKISDTNTKVVCGMEGLIECATYDKADTVLNSVVGMVGLQPTLEAIKAKKTLALANKETLVAGGHLVTNLAKENGVQILPVDSEHSAIFQSMQGMPNKKAIKKINGKAIVDFESKYNSLTRKQREKIDEILEEATGKTFNELLVSANKKTSTKKDNNNTEIAEKKAQLKQKIDDLKKQLLSAQSELENAQNAQSSAQSDVDSLQSQIDSAGGGVSDAQSAVISAQADYDNAQSALQACENRRSELEQIPNSELTQDQYTELQQLYAEHQGLVDNVNTTKSALADAKSALSAAQKNSDTSSLQNKLKSAKTKLDSANSDVTDAQSKVDSLNSQINDYQNQLNQLD